MAFTEKQITVQFSLANGQFEGGGNSAVVAGLRVACQIEVTGAPSFATMEAAIYGLPMSIMQQLSTVGSQWNARYKNGIDVLAGDDETGLSLIFSGTIFNAYIDAAQMPAVCLRVVAAPFVYESVVSADATSINGSADAAGMIQKLAGQIGAKGFENNGVSVKLASPYYYGSPWGQMREIADDGNFDIAVDRGIVVISPRGVPRQGDAPTISPATGLVSYPTFVQNRISVRALFDPTVKVLGSINVQSSLQPACGTWQVIKASYDLESISPGGNWFMSLDAVPLGTQ